MEKRFCIYGFLTGSPIVGGLSATRKLSRNGLRDHHSSWKTILSVAA